MKGYDAFAGVVKSGGKTRRAAKMVILDADHPDVLDFIDSKLNEEKKAWALIEQGYDPSFTGEAYGSVFFQNANHTVRVTDEFMQRGRDGRRLDDPLGRRPASRSTPTRPATSSGDGRRGPRLRRPGHPVRHDDQRLAHVREHGPDLRVQPVLRVHVPQRHGLQPGVSLNLMKFVDDDGEFDVEDYRYAARVTITAQEILVDNASLPDAADRGEQPQVPAARPGLRQPRRPAHDHAASPTTRDEGRELRGRPHRDHARRGVPPVARSSPATTAARSSSTTRTASRSCGSSASTATPPTRSWPIGRARRTCSTAARAVFDEALELGTDYGYRNAQVTVLAPTGTIAFMMDCDTTGIEPDIALIKYKKLVGEGFLKIVNQTVPPALRKLGYDADAGRGDPRLHQRARDDRGRARRSSPSTCRCSTARSSRSTASARSTTWATSG